jgi:hypothetical protein
MSGYVTNAAAVTIGRRDGQGNCGIEVEVLTALLWF